MFSYQCSRHYVGQSWENNLRINLLKITGKKRKCKQRELLTACGTKWPFVPLRNYTLTHAYGLIVTESASYGDWRKKGKLRSAGFTKCHGRKTDDVIRHVRSRCAKQREWRQHDFVVSVHRTHVGCARPRPPRRRRQSISHLQTLKENWNPLRSGISLARMLSGRKGSTLEFVRCVMLIWKEKWNQARVRCLAGRRRQQSCRGCRLHARQTQTIHHQPLHRLSGRRWSHGRTTGPAILQR